MCTLPVMMSVCLDNRQCGYWWHCSGRPDLLCGSAQLTYAVSRLRHDEGFLTSCMQKATLTHLSTGRINRTSNSCLCCSLIKVAFPSGLLCGGHECCSSAAA